MHGLQESLGRRSRLVGFNLDKHPAGSTLDDDKEETVAVLVGHLRQGFDAHMQEAGFISLERLVRRLLGGGLQGLEAADPRRSVIRTRQKRTPDLECELSSDTGFFGRVP
jgi:hypothetical protein